MIMKNLITKSLIAMVLIFASCSDDEPEKVIPRIKIEVVNNAVTKLNPSEAVQLFQYMITVILKMNQ